MYSNILEFQMIKLFLDKYKNTYVWIHENEAKGLISRTILNGRFFLARDYLQRGRYKN